MRCASVSLPHDLLHLINRRHVMCYHAPDCGGAIAGVLGDDRTTTCHSAQLQTPQLSACVQIPADRPTYGLGDADVFLGGAEQQFAFEFRIKAYRFDR